MHRRSLLLGLAASPLAARGRPAAAASAPRPALSSAHRSAHPCALSFPFDFGAHTSSRTEWWYVTGSLQSGARLWGFQVTFFRSSTGVEIGAEGAANRSQFAPSQLLFAHAALTDLEGRRLRHDQRIARSGFGIAEARRDDTGLVLRDWQMQRAAWPAGTDPQTARSRYRAQVTSESAGFAFDLSFDASQPVLLQGNAGLSRKGPGANDVSRYYSEPQLAVAGTLVLDARPSPVTGRAWLDHEWSDAFIPAQAVGWDWLGMNLDDGSALTAFRLRRADGSAVYAGGSFRRSGEAPKTFGANEVAFAPGRIWQSASSRARYPVEWTVDTPVGRFAVKALLDNQELDSRGSTGSIYWEGLSDLLDAAGRRVGRGYLEMTGYAAALTL